MSETTEKDDAIKIAIAGAPKSGKTTLAKASGLSFASTDDLIPHGWSEASSIAAKWLDRTDIQVVEGVAVIRAIRKWLQTNAGKPVDELIYLPHPHQELSKAQWTMAKSCWSIFTDLLPILIDRKTQIFVGSDGYLCSP